ncbi:MAG: polysaccharide biosynthesis protein [Clostridiales bacterium]|nr:polysaccharide biosynthesis protein [Clostridiales bacterium]
MESRKKKGGRVGFIKGAVWIAAGGFIAKIIGAVYRIPLTNLIGGRGLGLYQMVYPAYCLLLTVSATGIPSSIAKLTAERIGKNESTRPLFLRAMKLFVLIGLVGSVLLALLAPLLSAAQGSKEVVGGYYALAPAVVLVSAISVFRGWFQGRNEMSPTALSEILEQIVKVGFGLLFAYIFRTNVEKAVVFLLLAVSLSEAAALVFMLCLYRRKKPKKEENSGGRVALKAILKMSIPVTLSSLLFPMSNLLDSVLVPRLLGVYTGNAVTLYGLFSGGAVTMISLPVSVCYGIAAASIPSVAGAPPIERRKKIFFALGITAAVGAVSAAGLYFFASPAVRIIFRSLSGEESEILTRLVKSYAVSAFTLSCVQTLSACLTAQGKPQYASLSMFLAITVKTAVYVWLLQNPQISVFGLAYATNLCYLVAFFLNLLYNFSVSRKSLKGASK